MFQLGKLEFEEERTEISAYFTYDVPVRKNELTWHIEINTDSKVYKEEEADNENYEDYGEDFDFLPYQSPYLYHNEGIHINISSWKKLEGMVLNWDSEYNEIGDEAGVLYVFEHEDVTQSKIEFLERHGTKFLIRWSGTANVFYDNEYDTDVPFLFEGEIPFTGISIDNSSLSDQDLIETMKKFINTDEFVLVKEGYHRRLVPIE